jgi:flavin reductase (DIM6/NTAB) family NADH-FMN oxidoreductase RutF
VVEPFRSEAVEEGDPVADPRAFRRCLGQFSTGVGVMTTVANGEPVGVTANSFSSLSMDPPLVLWSIAHTSRSAAAFKKAKHFAVNILAVEQVEYSQRFASPAQNKFEDVDWRPGVAWGLQFCRTYWPHWTVRLRRRFKVGTTSF